MSDDYTAAPPAPETPPVAPVGGGFGPASDTSKILAALGYVFWVVALIAILIEPYKDEKWLRSHAIQGLALGVVIWVVTAVGTAIIIGPLLGLAGFIYQVVLALKAWKGETVEVPVIHGIVQQYI